MALFTCHPHLAPPAPRPRSQQRACLWPGGKTSRLFCGNGLQLRVAACGTGRHRPQATGETQLYTTEHYKRRHYKCTAVSCQSPQGQKSRKTGLQPSHWGPRPASRQSGGVAWPSGWAGTTSWPACRSDQTTAWRTHWSQTSAEEVGACARRSRWATSRRRSEVRTPNQKHGARCY